MFTTLVFDRFVSLAQNTIAFATITATLATFAGL